MLPPSHPLPPTSPPTTQNFVSDACQFVQYAQTLFNFKSSIDSFRHYHMYIHRVALSVVLPEPDPKPDHKPLSDSIFPPILEEPESLSDSSSIRSPPQPSPNFGVRGTFFSQSLPRRKHKAVATVEEKVRPRSSVQSDNVLLTKSPRAQRRGLFTKQHSIHERDDSSSTLTGATDTEVYGTHTHVV